MKSSLNKNKKIQHRLTLRLDFDVYSEISKLSYKHDVAINSIVEACIKFALVDKYDALLDLHDIERIAESFVAKKEFKHDDLSTKERISGRPI